MQFRGRAGPDVPRKPDAERAAATAPCPRAPHRGFAKACPQCRQHFSGDARFCPFDGEQLAPAPHWDPATDPMIGHVIDGRYEIECMLGEGGMGRVYRAVHGALGRRFALKLLKHELASDPALSARFIQEAKAVASVNSPSIVQITDFGQLPTGQPYFVMELLQGCALSRVINEQGPLSPRDTARVARPVAEGLGVAHAARIIHRDLKPDNIHIAGLDTSNPVVKVLDFGLAKVAGASRLTRDGMVFGTPHYMSPEQAAGEPLDQRVDIYALGVVMYEMATGRTPFEADTYMGVLTQHIHVVPVRPSVVLGRDSLGGLEEIILRCLAKMPNERYGDMEEVAQALRLVERGAERTRGVPLDNVSQALSPARKPKLQSPKTSSTERLDGSVEVAVPEDGLARARMRRIETWPVRGIVWWRSGSGPRLSLQGTLAWVMVVACATGVLALIYLTAPGRNSQAAATKSSPQSRLGPARSSVPPAESTLPPGDLSTREGIQGAPPVLPDRSELRLPRESPRAPTTPRSGAESGTQGRAQTAWAAGQQSVRSVPARRATAGRPSARRRGAPPAPSATAQSVEPARPAVRAPTLGGGDIVDPWAQ